ncbi:uncharacterized protein LOC141910893 isoform X2 [Tubulanus polymorphus]|uniref:uncharacterized protein LOC141910893 isoform X2 n=1 Tax=Tubulanus polymorphus TaxID=672921 RepID=UPI003DA67B20
MNSYLGRVVRAVAFLAIIQAVFGALRIKRDDIPEDQRCPGIDWAHYQSKCYRVETDRVNKQSATSECRRMDAGLVNIDTEAEWKFLESLFNQQKVSVIGFWTGGHRTGIRWKWDHQTLKVDGKEIESDAHESDIIRKTETSDFIPVTFEYWFNDEPNQGGISGTVGMTLAKDTFSWGWRDRVTEFKYPYICEKAKTDACEKGWSHYGESCYLVQAEGEMSQPAAKADCRSKGSHLVAINSRKENEFIISTIKSEKNNREWWIGGENMGGKFVWDITIPLQKPYLKMWGRSSRGNDGWYMSMIKDKGEWWMKATRRSTKLHYICEIPVQHNKFFKCPANYIFVSNACYDLAFEKVDRQKAAKICNNDGGHLIAIDNEAELEHFATLMKELHFDDEIWTGGIMVDSQWVWSRDHKKFLGTPNQFLAWGNGEPNNWDGKENLLAIAKNSEGHWHWNDVPTSSTLRLGYICEKGARPYEPIEYNKACKTNRAGDGYLGKLSRTRQGNKCRRWDSALSPYNKPNRLHLFPDNVTSISEISNFCRNPDNSERGPWCYQKDGGGRAYCYIPLCEDKQFVTSKCVTPGAAYIGKVSVTKSGKTCLRWDSAQNHVMNRPELFPDPSVKEAQNYCRAPSGSALKKPWCFTGSNGKREECDIPACVDETEEETGETVVPIVPVVEDKEPTLDTQPEDVVGFVGETVNLPCEVKNKGQHAIMWLKKEGLRIISLNEIMIIDDQRMSIQHASGSGEWNLRISNVKKDDQGSYMCSLNTMSTQRKLVNLLVKGVPEEVTTTVDPYSIDQLKEKLSGRVVTLKAPRVLSSTSVGLEWTVVKSKQFIEGFNVLYKKIPASAGEEELSIQVQLNPAENKELKYVVNSLEKNTRYNFRVQPYFKTVKGTISNGHVATTLEDVPSKPPQNIKLRMMTRTTMILSWRPPPADSANGIITGYQIHLSSEGVDKTTRTSRDTLQHAFTDIEPDKEYNITIAAMTGAGIGVKSEPVKLARPCKSNFIRFGRQCYYVSRSRVTRRSAVRACGRLDAKLATIETKPVFSFLTRYLDTKVSRWGRTQFWTGGERFGLKWGWDAEAAHGNSNQGVPMVTHTPLTYENWRSGEPNHYDEIAISMKYSSGFWGWNDIYTKPNYQLRYMCEKEIEQAENCGSSVWIRHKNSCYFFSSRSDGRSHERAKSECRRKFSHLVAINSKSENDFLERELNKRKSRSSRYEEWWTGGEREGGVGGDTFIWDTTIPGKGMDS